MLLSSMQVIPRSQTEEESSLLRRKTEEESSSVATQDRRTEQEYCPFDRRGWEIDPRVETAIGSPQVLRRPQHEAEGGPPQQEIGNH